MGDLSKNFSKSEFDCNSGCDMPEDVFENVEVHAQNLQTIRNFLNESIKINSGYRCPSYNSSVGGIGRYNTSTHYDRRGTKARWDNTTN